MNQSDLNKVKQFARDLRPKLRPEEYPTSSLGGLYKEDCAIKLAEYEAREALRKELEVTRRNDGMYEAQKQAALERYAQMRREQPVRVAPPAGDEISDDEFRRRAGFYVGPK